MSFFVHLSAVRRAEMEEVLAAMPAKGSVLEIGAGTGEQARLFADKGYDVCAIDLAHSNYADRRTFQILDYDGRSIPFPDARFDVVYSSNVLEHVIDLDVLQGEIRRVLKPDGRCIHLIPTPAWRVWTSLASVPNAFRFFVRAVAVTVGARRGNEPYSQRVATAWRRSLGRFWEIVRQPRHGEHGTALGELFLFARAHWCRRFGLWGFDVVDARPVGLFYTGHGIFGARLGVAHRRRLSRFLGSGCNLYILRLGGPGPRSACVTGQGNA